MGSVAAALLLRRCGLSAVVVVKQLTVHVEQSFFFDFPGHRLLCNFLFLLLLRWKKTFGQSSGSGQGVSSAVVQPGGSGGGGW